MSTTLVVEMTAEEALRLQRAQLRDGETLEGTLLRLAGIRGESAPGPRAPDDAILRIKHVREHTSCGLKEAKDAVEATGWDEAAAIRLVSACGRAAHGTLARRWTEEDVLDALRPGRAK